MDWTRGYSARWRVMRVNRDTWEDEAEVPGITSVDVERSCAEDAPLLESATIHVDLEPGRQVPEGWYRVEMLATQGGESTRHAIATLLVLETEAEVDRGVADATLEGWSVLKPAQDVKMPVGSYAPAGCDGAAFARDLIAVCTPAPVTADGSFTLDSTVVFDAGASNLEAAWKVVGAASWCIWVDGRGGAHIGPRGSEPALSLDSAAAGLLVPGITHRRDVSDTVNRYFAVDGDSVAVVANEDPASPTSTAARGRYVDYVDTAPTRVDGETLEAYARRRLSELSTVTTEYTYTREWWPDVHPMSLVRATLTAQGFEGDLRVVSQSLDCSHGITVTETASLEEEGYSW